MSEPLPDSRRLTGRNGLVLIGLFAFGAVCLAVSLHLFPSVFPEATIDFEFDRKASKGIAEGWLRESGFDLSGYRHASVFLHADTAKVFLERELGLEAMNEAVEQTARIWAWSHRWFRPVTVEEFQVDIAPTGELVRFEHLLADSTAGANLPEEEARLLAEEFLAGLRGGGLGGLRYLGATSNRLDARTDHRFTWEREGIDWGGGRYRHRVTIRGDRLGGYEEFVKVPEAWTRGYSRLRSSNTAAGAIGSIFYILTVLGMFVVLFLEMKKGRIRWRFSALFGLIGGALTLLSQASDLSGMVYRYDTSDSFGGFVATAVLGVLLSALASGVLITLVVATGENRYRIHYPQKLSLPAIFTWRGLRTKEFLFSAFAGLVLTCGFLAYQTLFYRVASSFGAWSPADVPYTDLLNSSIPWAFLLFIGFFPAVSEEFLSRAFSIPFFTKLFRSRVTAVLLASLIWGLLHSAYPNQPFYIRVIELTVAGAFVSVLMLRFNVLMLLVWHYTVDAVYSGYLLLRSGDTYYVGSAVVAGGILVLPLIVAVAAYVRTRRFGDPEGLRHRAEPLPDEPVAVVPPPLAPAAVKPLTRGRLLAAVGVSAAVLAVVLELAAGVGQPELAVPIAVDRAAAKERAAAFLSGQGIDAEAFRTVIRFTEAIDPDASRYVLAHEGLVGVASLWPERLAARTWSVRFFEAEQAEEVRVHVDASGGRIIAYDHRIAEGDSLPTAEAGAAESLAVRLLDSVGLAIAGMDRKEASEDPRPKRMDRSFVWEAPEEDARNVAEARYRVEADVTGDRAAGFDEWLRLPEDYERARSKRTFFWGIGLALILIGGGGVLGFSIFDGIRSRAGGVVPFKRLIPAGVIGLLVSVVASLNGLPRLIYRYETSVPWGNYMIFVVVGLLTAMVLYFFFAWAGTGLVLRLHPSVASVADASARKRMVPGALLALVLAPVWTVVLGKVRFLIAAWLPQIGPPPILHGATNLETSVPALGVLATVVPRVFMLCFVAALLIHLIRSRTQPAVVRYCLPLAIGIGLALLPARGAGEFLIILVRLGLTAGVAFWLVRWLLRDNPLAYVGAAYGVFALDGVSGLIGQPDAWVRGHGLVAGVLLLVPVMVLVFGAFRATPAGRGSETPDPYGQRRDVPDTPS